MTTRIDETLAAARKQPKQARSKQLVSYILEAAARVFDREGLEATTNRIAQEAGVSVGSLYQYFPNKQALLLALAERHVDTAAKLLEQAAAEHSDATSVTDFMRAMVHAVVCEHREHPHLRPLLRSVGPSSPLIAQRFAQCIADAEQRITQLLERLHPRVEAPKLRAKLIVAAVDGVIHNSEAVRFDQQFEEEVVAMCVCYLEH